LAHQKSYFLEEANNFDIKYNEGYKVVTDIVAKREYILYPCGNAKPTVSESTPSGFVRRYFTVPLQKVAVDDTTLMGYMQALDNGGSVMGVTDRIASLTKYAIDPCAQKALATCTAANNKVVDQLSVKTPGYGAGVQDYHAILNHTDAYFNWGDSASTKYNPSRVVSFKASGVRCYSPLLMHCIPSRQSRRAPPIQRPNTSIFHISPFLFLSLYQENSILGRVEWIKYLAAFFNLELEAGRYFNKIKTRVNDLKESARQASTRPKVAFVQYICDDSANYIYGYTQGACGGNEFWEVSTAEWKVDAVESAGGSIRHMYDDIFNTELVPSPNTQWTQSQYGYGRWDTTALADIQALLMNVDVLIDETYYSDPSLATPATILGKLQLTGATGQGYNFIDDEKIYREDKKMSKDSGYWSGTLQRVNIIWGGIETAALIDILIV